MTEIYNFSAGPAMMPKKSTRKSATRIIKLARPRHISDGSQPPWKAIYGAGGTI